MGTADTPITEVAARHGSLVYRAVMRTDVGRRRTENQDSFGFAVGSVESLFIVADGMGGARGGGTASAMAVNLILDDAVDGTKRLDPQGLERAISSSNHVIYARSQEDSQLNGMGTTVVAIGFVDTRAIVAHVGDSRAYRYRGGELVQLTRDHTLVQELVDSGAIQPEDAATHPIAHMLTRSLGPMASIGVDVRALDGEVAPGDRFLLCSDGLYNHCPKEAISRALGGKDLRVAANTMLNLALENGGTDNVTLQIIEVLPKDAKDAKTPDRTGVERMIQAEIDVSAVNGVPLRQYAQSLSSSAGAVGGATPVAPAGKAVPTETKSGQTETHRHEPPPRPPPAPPHEVDELATILEEARSDSEPRLTGELDDFRASVDPFEGGGGALDDYSGYTGYEADVMVPRWWTSFLAGVLTFVFAGVFYALYQRDFMHSHGGSSRRTPERGDPRQREKVAADLFSWSPDSDAERSAAIPEQPPTQSPPAQPGSSQPGPVSGTQGQAPLAPEATLAPAASDGGSQLAKNTAPVLLPEPALPVSSRDSTEQPVPASAASTEGKVENPGFDVALAEAKRAAEQRGSQEMLAEQVALASTFQIPSGPRVRLGGIGDAKPNQPIDWEVDAKRAADIASVPQPVKTPEPTLLTAQEQFELAEEKRRTREKISDVDVKLEMLVIETSEDAGRRRVLAEMEAARATTATDTLQREIGAQRAELKRWQSVQSHWSASEPLKVVDELAELSPEVKHAREALQAATENYKRLDAQSPPVSLSNPAPRASTQLAAAGRERAKLQAELEAAVVAEMPQGAGRVKRRLARLENDLHAVELRRDLLNRHIGMLRAFVPATLSRRQLLQKEYLKERTESVRHLRDLQGKLSDDQEARFRLERVDMFGAG